MTTENQIQEMLLKLQELLEKIDVLRQRSVEVEKGMAEVRSCYDNRLGDLNKEAEQLDVLRYSLRSQLQEIPENISIQNEVEEQLQDNHNLLIDNQPSREDTLLVQDLEPNLKDIRRRRKEKLANHILFFVDPSQENVVKIINTILIDDMADVGEMLERLAWGQIWAERADWESLDDQYQRLSEWQQALEDRLTYWDVIVQGQKIDTCYALWQEWSKGEEHWEQFLDELVAKQQADNERLTHEITVLENELQSR